MRYPWWRRILAPFSLAALIVIIGLTLAALMVAFAMLMLYALEQAVG